MLREAIPRNVRYQVYDCAKCGETWEIALHQELGKWLPDSEDAEYCPVCEARGVAADNITYRPELESKSGKDTVMPEKEDTSTNIEGIVEAALSGETTLRELIDLVDANDELGEEFGMGRNGNAADPAELAMRDHIRREKRRRMQPDDAAAARRAGCPAPGSKRRSAGRGRGLARGRGLGPVGAPRLGMGGRGENAPAPEEPVVEVEEQDELAAQPYELSQLTSFGDFIKSTTEACRPKKKSKKKKESLDEGIHEFAAPERQDVIRWGRGSGAKRTSERLPFYFDGDAMFSRKKKIAERDLESKKARILSPGVLDAHSGRHAVLCQKGLSYCGYEVEMVENLE